MELYGEIVTHKAFSKGRIVAFDNKYVTISFDETQSEKWRNFRENQGN